MGINCTIDLKTADGREADAMRKIIALRTKELGETTKQACKAIAINVLKSLRANTRVANEKIVDITITNVDSQYFPSWKKDGKKHKRILRAGPNGAEITDKKVYWNTDKYRRGEVYHTFLITDNIGEDKKVEYLLVSYDENWAMKKAKKLHETKVLKGKFLAKYALGLAMHYVHERENNNVGQITSEAKKTGVDNVKVSVIENGFNSGDISIHIEDKLDYAALALKDGETYIQTAIQKSLNSMIGYLKHKLKEKGSINESLETPFPELTK